MEPAELRHKAVGELLNSLVVVLDNVVVVIPRHRDLLLSEHDLHVNEDRFLIRVKPRTLLGKPR